MTYLFLFLWLCGPTRTMASLFLMFLDHTQRHTTVGRTPLDEWSARRRDLYLTTHNIHNRQTSMPPVGFEPTVSAGERPQNYALDRAATGTGMTYLTQQKLYCRVGHHCWVGNKPVYLAVHSPHRKYYLISCFGLYTAVFIDYLFRVCLIFWFLYFYLFQVKVQLVSKWMIDYIVICFMNCLV